MVIEDAASATPLRRCMMLMLLIFNIYFRRHDIVVAPLRDDAAQRCHYAATIFFAAIAAARFTIWPLFFAIDDATCRYDFLLRHYATPR